MFFGQRSQENVKTIKKRCTCMKICDFDENACKKKGTFFLEDFALIRARAGPIWALMRPYGPKNQKNIYKIHLNRCLEGVGGTVKLKILLPHILSFF